MAGKIISDLELISSFSSSASIPIDDGLQTYRTTGLQVANYISAALNGVTGTQLANKTVTYDKIADNTITTNQISASAGILRSQQQTRLVDIGSQALVGTVGSVNQKFAGHLFPTAITEFEVDVTDVVAQYSLNAAGASITADDTSNAYTLTDHGTIAAGAGIFGGTTGAATFNGSSQYYTQATLLDTLPSIGLAVSFWFKATDGQPSANAAFFKKISADSPIQHVQLILTTGGLIQMYLNTGASGDCIITSQTKLPDGATGWYHVVCNWDGSNGMRLWINGILEAHDNRYTAMISNGTARDFIIGATNTSGSVGTYFAGSIAQFKIMNKALTQFDVDALYASTYDLPADLVGVDFNLEAKIYPTGLSAYTRITNVNGCLVGKNASSIYRMGFTPGIGFLATDNILLRGRI
jgi:hypothetical protein